MKPLYPLLMAVGTLLVARPVFAEDIVVRLVDVNSGAGVRNCDVGLLLGDPMGHPRPAATRLIQTSADGRARFSLTPPLPRTVWADANTECAVPCDRVTVLPLEEILKTGVTKGMTGATNLKGEQYCRPNYKKLEEIAAKPGEILVFVRKLSWLEHLSRH